MKKALLFVLLAVCGTLGVRAQKTGRWYDYDRTNYFGVRLGATVSQLYTKNIDNASVTSALGWNTGFVCGHQLGRGVPLFVEGGLLYMQKQVKATFRKAQNEHDLSLSYLEVPVVFKYKAATAADDLTVQPFAGGFFAIGVGGNDRSYSDHKNYNAFDGRGFKRVDAGLRLGCALAYQNFYFEMAYDIGLVNIADADACDRIFDYDEFDNRIHTGCFTVSVGLDF